MHIYSQEKSFYVYQYLRTYKSKSGDIGTPYYVGKGKGERAFRKYSGIKIPKNKTKIQIVAENMNEADAFQLEMLLIHLYGRIDIETGCLRNRTDGGDGCAGLICKTETRIKLSKVRKLPRGPHSAVRKQNISLAKQNLPKQKCEFCQQFFTIHNYKRWHGTNCKQNPQYIGPKIQKKRSPRTEQHCKNLSLRKTGQYRIVNDLLRKSIIIDPNELESYLNAGWRRGMKINCLLHKDLR